MRRLALSNPLLGFEQQQDHLDETVSRVGGLPGAC
jgi:hypothetical protein